MNEPTDAVKRDMFHLLCGKVLGAGVARTVYEHTFDPTVVIKVEANGGSFQNVIEWETWQRIQHTEHAQWFAPCVAISPNGLVLIQKRTRRPSVFPDKVPSFFTDLKHDNFGFLPTRTYAESGELAIHDNKGRFVCHDYGYHLLMEQGMTKRMRKADWWTL